MASTKIMRVANEKAQKNILMRGNVPKSTVSGGLASSGPRKWGRSPFRQSTASHVDLFCCDVDTFEADHLPYKHTYIFIYQ